MSTLQNTISMLEVLPESDLIKVQNFTKKLSKHHELEAVDEAAGRFLKPMSRADFMQDVKKAEQEIANGKYSSVKEVFHGLERRYKF